MAYVLAALAGWLIADLLTGVVHWIEDRIDGDSWLIVGSLIFAPNRLHHEQPIAFTRNGFWSRNGTSISAALGVGGTLVLILYVAFGTGVPSWAWVALGSATFGGAMANQVHYWAHMPHRAPGIVQALQSIGLCQSRHHHARHHAPPQQDRYCVLTNWLNPWLDRNDVWKRLERFVPKRWLV